jgi:hypothetical protein
MHEIGAKQTAFHGSARRHRKRGLVRVVEAQRTGYDAWPFRAAGGKMCDAKGLSKGCERLCSAHATRHREDKALWSSDGDTPDVQSLAFVTPNVDLEFSSCTRSPERTHRGGRLVGLRADSCRSEDPATESGKMALIAFPEFMEPAFTSNATAATMDYFRNP